MPLTNNGNLPAHLYDRIYQDVLGDPYSNIPNPENLEVFRTTELIKLPRPRTLKKQFRASPSFVVDASHYLPLVFGTAFHKLMEGEDTETLKFEMRVSRDIEVPGLGKYRLVGTIDEIDLAEPRITDNKTSLTSSRNYPLDEDYIWQVNIYAWMAGILDKNPKLFLRFFYKDWTAKSYWKWCTRTYGYEENYPYCAIVSRPVPVKTVAEVEEFVWNRLRDHVLDPMRLCSEEERCFGNPVEYRIYKKKNPDRAFKLIKGDRQEAEALLASLPVSDGAYMTVTAEEFRCMLYCDAKCVCDYAREKGYR